jgi:hypothetical protein
MSSYGVLLRKAKRNDEAKVALVGSVRAFPLNWSAFLELSHVVQVSAIYWFFRNLFFF